MDVLIESHASYIEAKSPGNIVWSCSSGIETKLSKDKIFKNPESLISNAEYNSLCKTILKSRSEIERVLLSFEKSNSDLKYLSTTHTAQIYSLFLLAATKAQILSKWLDNTKPNDRLVIGSPNLLPVNGISAYIGCYDNIFSVLIKLLAGSESELNILNEVRSVDEKLFENVFNSVSLYDRFFNIFNRTCSAIIYQIWKKISNKFLCFNKKGTVLLISDNEGIEEAFLTMALNGWGIVSVKKDIKQVNSHFTINMDGLEKSMAYIWEKNVREELSAPMLEVCWSFIWGRLKHVFKNHTENLFVNYKLINNWSIKYGSKNTKLVVLGNGLYSPNERLLDSCLRDKRIPVICTDHGSSIGLVKRQDYLLSSYISFSDYYLSYNIEAANLYRKFKKRKEQKVSLIPGPHILRNNKLSTLKKYITRLFFKFGLKDNILMYVTSLTANNYPYGYSCTTDSEYVLFRERVVKQLKVYKGKVLIKPYPMHRYIDPDKIWEENQLDNISIAPFCEFKNFRYVSDLLLLDISSSTISWAVTSKIPIIYINNATNALSKKAEKEFKKAFFYIDSSESDWEKKLESIISTPLKELKIRWQKKEKAREECITNYIVSGNGSFKKEIIRVLKLSSA